MKKFLVFFALSSFVQATSLPPVSFPQVEANLSFKEGNVETKEYKNDEAACRSSWNSLLPVCWADKRIIPCTVKAQQNLTFQCHQSCSANCPGASCKISGLIEGVNQVGILKGESRDFLVLKGDIGGCGGSTQTLAIVNENGKLACKFVESFDHTGNHEDEMAGELIDKIYKNYQKYLKWQSTDACVFKLSKKEQKILKGK